MMYILIIKYRERGTIPNVREETKLFCTKCEVYRYISFIKMHYYIISYSIYIKVEENGHTVIDNSK